MYHFFITREQVAGDTVTVTGADVNHIRNVLRMKAGEAVQVTDEQGTVYTCRIAGFPGDTVTLSVEDAAAGENELPSELVLFQGIPKSDKMELIIQKAVELGAAAIVPTEMKRCVAKIDPKKEEAKLKRYRAIAESAAKQSGRNRIPEVMPVMTLKEAIRFAERLNHVFVPYEHADNMAETKAAIAAVKPGESVGIFIGPEGGFEESEVAAITEAGGREISLGKRILRTETAGMTLLSVLMFQLS